MLILGEGAGLLGCDIIAQIYLNSSTTRQQQWMVLQYIVSVGYVVKKVVFIIIALVSVYRIK
jgi:hypothetical protein